MEYGVPSDKTARAFRRSFRMAFWIKNLFKNETENEHRCTCDMFHWKVLWSSVFMPTWFWKFIQHIYSDLMNSDHKKVVESNRCFQKQVIIKKVDRRLWRNVIYESSQTSTCFFVFCLCRWFFSNSKRSSSLLNVLVLKHYRRIGIV